MTGTLHPPADPWPFAVWLYGLSDMAGTFLDLQDRHKIDVPLLLWLIWAGWQGRSVDGDELLQAVSLSTKWQRDIVQPIRTVRKRLKFGPAPAVSEGTARLRANLAVQEQDAERLQIKALTDSFPRQNGQPDPQALDDNVCRLLTLSGAGELIGPFTVRLHNAMGNSPDVCASVPVHGMLPCAECGQHGETTGEIKG
jgi:uncharacterized protein (TIGR02444 family)